MHALDTPRTARINLDSQQAATLLAALRFYQQQGFGDPFKRPDDIHIIATGGGDDTSHDDAGINELCQQINFGDARYERQDLATVLAALHYYHQEGLGEPFARPLEIHEIATDGGVTSLDEAGIEELIQQLTDGNSDTAIAHDSK